MLQDKPQYLPLSHDSRCPHVVGVEHDRICLVFASTLTSPMRVQIVHLVTGSNVGIIYIDTIFETVYEARFEGPSPRRLALSGVAKAQWFTFEFGGLFLGVTRTCG